MSVLVKYVYIYIAAFKSRGTIIQEMSSSCCFTPSEIFLVQFHVVLQTTLCSILYFYSLIQYYLQCYWVASGGVREARKLFLCFEQCSNGSVTSQKADSGSKRTNKTTANEGRLMATEISESFLSKNNFPEFLNGQKK